MSYKFYTVNREELFECSINTTNVSDEDSIVRLIIETNDLSLVFNGKIENNEGKF